MEKTKEKVLIALRKRAMQLYADKIELKEFIEYLYSDEVLEFIDSESLIFDLVDINFNSDDWEKKLYWVLNEKLSEEESISLKLYICSKEILKTQNFDELEQLILEIARMIDWDKEVSFVVGFYCMHDELDEWECYYSSKEEMQGSVHQWSKLMAEEFVANYNECEEEEDFEDLLYRTTSSKPLSEEELANLKTTILKSEKEECQSGVLVFTLMGFIKTFVGIIALEKGKFMYAFLVIGIGMLLSSIYYMIRLIRVNKEIKQTRLGVSA